MSDEDLIERYCTWKRHNAGAAASTVDHYGAHLRRLRKHAGKSLTKLTPDELEAYTGPELHKQGLNANGRRNVVAAIRGFYRYLLHHQVVRENPAAELHYPRAGRSLPEPIPAEHAEALMWAPDLETFIGVRDSAIMATLIGCGLRVGGLVAMNEEDLLFVREKDKREELVIRIREKGSHERFVPAPDVTRLMLRAYLGHRDLDAIDRRLEDGQRVLFVSVGNRLVADHEYRGAKRRLTEWSIRDILQRYAKRAGVPEKYAHPHAFRHLFGQELAEADVDVLIRQQLLGHKDPKSTAVYSHIAFRKLRKAIEQSSPFQRIRTPVTDLAERF